MTDKPGVFSLHAIGQKDPHTFEPGEIPNNLFLAINERVESDIGIPERNIYVKHFINIEILKGKPCEDEVREMIGLSPRKSS